MENVFKSLYGEETETENEVFCTQLVVYSYSNKVQVLVNKLQIKNNL